MNRPALTSASRIARRATGTRAAARMVPEEVAVALSFGGTTHAVMMASPVDLEDFALGFSLTEGIVSSSLRDRGDRRIEDQVTASTCRSGSRTTANRRFEARRRRLAGPVGCGLCGIESIEEAMRAVRDVGGSALALTSDRDRPLGGASVEAPADACRDRRGARGRLLRARQWHRRRHRRGARGCRPAQRARQAGGRAGESWNRRPPPARWSSPAASRWRWCRRPRQSARRCIVAVSAPTALAIRTAEAAGMTLVALVRGEEFDIFTRPDRIISGAARHVA